MSQLPVFTVADQDANKVVRPAEGFALLESKDFSTGEAWRMANGEVYYRLLFGEKEIKTWHDGRVSKMQLVNLPHSPVQQAVRVPAKFEKEGERLVYLEEHGPLTIERLGEPIYSWQGQGQVARGADGRPVLKAINKGVRPNPESVTKSGLLKKGYITLQAQLLNGVKFDTAVPADPYLRGLHICGAQSTIDNGDLIHDQMFLFVVSGFQGVPVIGGMHAFELLGRMAGGEIASYTTPEGEYGPVIDGKRAFGLWKWLVEHEAANIAANAVTISLS